MFKKIIFCAVCAAAIMLTAACSSVQVATDLGTPISDNPALVSKGHINVDIWGLYPFFFPLFLALKYTVKCCTLLVKSFVVFQLLSYV